MSTAEPAPHLWERYARAEPYWAVLTEPRFASTSLTPDAIEAFYASGRQHVAGVMATARAHLARPLAPVRALDFGCGTGRLLIPLAEAGCDVTGIDIAPSMLAEAATQAQSRGLAGRCTFLQADAVDWQALAGTCDLVHSYIVFQHVPQDEGLPIIERLLACLAPGGVAALHVLYANHFVPSAAVARQEATRPCAELPPMLMATYDMNRVLTLCNALRPTAVHLQLVNQGPYAGAMVYVQRPA
jgi:SAM-dependent methyltransferase